MSEQEILYRSTTIAETRAINEEERTVELAFSSEQPVERMFGSEVLDHSPESVDLSRMNDGAPLLLEHDRTQHIGVGVMARGVDDKGGRAGVRFSKSDKAQEIFQDVKDGIRRLVSVGYSVARFAKEKSEQGMETMRAVDWQPMEISLVSIPADQSVGVGRTAEIEEPAENIEPLEPMIEHEKSTEETVVENAVNEAPEVRVEVRPDKRSEEIAALGQQFDASREAVEFIGEGKSADEFKTYLIERNANTSKVIEKGDEEIGMGKKERKQYSLARAILQASEGNLDGIELEASQELEKRFGQPAKGFYVPYDIFGRAQRDLTATGGDTGDKLVATDLQDYIPALSAAPVVAQLGARVLSGLSSNVSIPKGGSMTAAWLTENADTSESTPTLSQISLSPKRVSALGELSKQLLVQASYDVESIVRNDILLQLSLAIDSAAISGSGSSGVPTGITNTSSIGTETFSSAFTYANVVNMETDVATANALNGSLAYLMKPSGRGSLKQTTLDSGSGRFIMEGNTLNGYTAGVSTQVPADTMIFGDFSQLIIAEFGAGADIVVDPYTKATTGLTRIHVQRFADIAVRHPEAFSVCS